MIQKVCNFRSSKRETRSRHSRSPTPDTTTTCTRRRRRMSITDRRSTSSSSERETTAREDSANLAESEEGDAYRESPTVATRETSVRHLPLDCIRNNSFFFFFFINVIHNRICIGIQIASLANGAIKSDRSGTLCSAQQSTFIDALPTISDTRS